MKLKEILTISGKPGLYKLVKQTGNGVIVESLEDKKRFPAFAHQKISSLEEISIFTDTEDMPLKDVLKKMAEKHERGPSINPKSSSEELKSYFAEIVPEYDEERVYVSHIKKIIQWYNILQKNDLLDFEEEEEETSGEEQSGSSQAHEDETGQQDEGQSDQSTKEENS
ncbi:MAG: DUF5606 domain-containing protein [Bacteroidales bacterium]|nr:DUF5606 domain-containing protein [Bacteroidales bacterium]